MNFFLEEGVDYRQGEFSPDLCALDVQRLRRSCSGLHHRVFSRLPWTRHRFPARRRGANHSRDSEPATHLTYVSRSCDRTRLTGLL
jgi:hypothetical protein